MCILVLAVRSVQIKGDRKSEENFLKKEGESVKMGSEVTSGAHCGT